MANRKKLYILAYDVSDDRRRRRVARILEEEGSRVQFSVFEARLTTGQIDKLVKAVSDEIGESDSLRVYACGKAGEKRSFSIGSGVEIDQDADYWLL